MYTVLVEKPEVKIPHGTHRHRWDDNIKVDTEEIRWERVGYIYLAIYGTISLSTRTLLHGVH
jgi:hypothetical protein